MRLVLTLLLALAFTLAGCTDDASTDSGTDTNDDTGDTGDGTAGGTEPETPDEEPAPPAAIYENGTVSGVLDCQLVSQDQAPQSAKTYAVPAEAVNRTYTITKVVTDTTLPDQATLCFSYDGGTTWGTTASGTLTEDIKEIRIASSGAPNGVGYSIYIE